MEKFCFLILDLVVEIEIGTVRSVKGPEVVTEGSVLVPGIENVVQGRGSIGDGLGMNFHWNFHNFFC